MLVRKLTESRIFGTEYKAQCAAVGGKYVQKYHKWILNIGNCRKRAHVLFGVGRPCLCSCLRRKYFLRKYFRRLLLCSDCCRQMERSSHSAAVLGDRSTRTAVTLARSLQQSLKRRSTRRFVITEKAPTRAFSWLTAATTAFTFKTLLRHYAKQSLTPWSLNVKLGPQRNYHKGRAAIRHYANQTARPL